MFWQQLCACKWIISFKLPPRSSTRTDRIECIGLCYDCVMSYFWAFGILKHLLQNFSKAAYNIVKRLQWLSWFFELNRPSIVPSTEFCYYVRAVREDVTVYFLNSLIDQIEKELLSTLNRTVFLVRANGLSVWMNGLRANRTSGD